VIEDFDFTVAYPDHLDAITVKFLTGGIGTNVVNDPFAIG